MTEIVPLAVFARWRWPMDDVFVKHWRGNQGFDAEASSERNGVSIRKVEITWPRDGKRQKREAGWLNRFERGRLRDLGAESKGTLEALRKTARRKEQNDYRGGILVFVCEQVMDFGRSALLDVVGELKNRSWRADEVYVLLNPSNVLIGKACPNVVRIK